MPGVNCSVLGCVSCRRLKRLENFKLPAAKGKERNEWLGKVTKAQEIDQDFREQIINKTTKCEDERPKNIEICKYRFIFCRTVEICFHTFTTRNHNSSGRVVEFVVWLFSASFSVYISCLFSNHPICMCLFSPL